MSINSAPVDSFLTFQPVDTGIATMQRLGLLLLLLALAWSSSSHAFVVPSPFQQQTPRPQRRFLPAARPSLPQSTLGAELSVIEALDMLQGLDRPTVNDYNVALAACARDGNHGGKHDAGAPASTQPRCGRLTERLADGLTALQHTTTNYSEPACWLIEEIAEWGMEPDRTSYALAIEACAPAGLVEEARHLLDCMKNADHDLDVEVYGHVAMACERAKNWRQLMWCVRRPLCKVSITLA